MGVDPRQAITFAPLEWGWATMFRSRDPYSNFQDAFYFTPWIDVPQSSHLIGARLCFEVVSVSLLPGFEGVFGVTNTLEVTFR